MDSAKRASRGALLESWLEFHRLAEEHPEVRNVLFDPVTGLPTTPLLFPRIRMLLEERGEVTMLCINVVRFSKIEEIYGWKVFDEVMRAVAAALTDITGTVLRDSDILAELMISGNAFVVVLSPPRRSMHITDEARQLVAEKVEKELADRLRESLDPALLNKFGCYVGSSTAVPSENVRLERLVYEALETALEESLGCEQADARTRAECLSDILDEGSVKVAVHPIFEIPSMDVIGYEVLSRGPDGSEFECPDKLFRVAYDSQLVFRLERLCRKRALEAAKDLPDGRLLFINVEPETISDPQLRDITASALLADAKVAPDQVVLEITERTAIVDFAAFRSTLEYLRALGFAVAIDDAGAGYGSLQCVAELKPDWLKIDMSLVRDCDSDPVRAQLISSLVSFADNVGVRLIAEGIETEAELETLKGIGVRYAQGFLFTEPLPPFPGDEVFAHLRP